MNLKNERRLILCLPVYILLAGLLKTVNPQIAWQAESDLGRGTIIIIKKGLFNIAR